MAIALGEDFRLKVRTATGPDVYTTVLGMDEWEQTDSQTIDTFPSFGAATPLGIPTPPDVSFSISGFFDPVDPGQVELRAVGAARTTEMIQVLHDGTNGYDVLIRVGARTHGASASGGPQRQSFEFAPAGDPTAVGSGPIY
jgi:flagellar basal body rod protein FlgF